MHETVSFASASKLFSDAGFSLTQEQYNKLDLYAEMLIKESEFQNVTAVKDPAGIWERHFLDSAVLLSLLENGSPVLDIGTGGGIPAIPLAILNPSLHFTLLDSELNKIDFCKRAIAALEIEANAICGRAEELAHDSKYREQFSYTISRAMAAGSMLSELGVPFLEKGGKLIAMKGKNFDDQAERFTFAAETLNCTCEIRPYSLQNEQKTLVILTKQAETDPKYPRRFAKIKRNPL